MLGVFDFETTIFESGNPFSLRNKAVCLGIKREDKPTDVVADFTSNQDFFDKTTLLVGFNIKFDLHWLRRVGVTYNGKIWDCQVAEFILNNQTTPYPSLADCCERYGLSTKLDKVKEYWDNGVDTLDIPTDVLYPYCATDVELTYQVYLKQQELFNTTHKHKKRLALLIMADTKVLQEMEYNGICWDMAKAKELSADAVTKLDTLRKEILGSYHSLPINLASGDHLSAFLYGGTIIEDYKLQTGLYKSGAKQGQPRYNWFQNKYEFPRLFEPLAKSELKKEGYFSTDEATLKQLKGKKEHKLILQKLDEYAKLDKLKGTYYDGITNLITNMDWPTNMIHGQLNQVVAKTGRLSSSKPNLQNQSEQSKVLMYTRY